jgi:hypothetical protein
MPLISIRIIYSEAETLPIAFLSAGEDQNILCASIVQLEGEVAAVPGTYTFEWEQLSGTPVTLENSDTLSPWFLNPNTGDFVFRLWVNRSTPEEMFSDVEIFRNPAAATSNVLSNTPFDSFPVILSGAAVSSESNLLLQARVEPSLFSDQNSTLRVESRGPDEYAILWEHPATTNPEKIFLGVDVERWQGGWVLDIFRPPAKKYANISSGQSYRLVSLWYNGNTNTISRETDNKIFVVTANRPTQQTLGIVSPLENTINLIAINNLESYLEQRSLRTSLSKDHTNTVSEHAKSYANTSVFRAAGVPIEDFTDNATNTGISEHLGSDPSDTQITRASGISIG